MSSSRLCHGMIRLLLRASAVMFTISGVAMLLAPAAMLSVVGIGAEPVPSFLLRTEGAPQLALAILLWVAPVEGTAARPALAAVFLFHVLSSLVDLDAHRLGLVGPAAVPSAVVRLALAGWAVWALVATSRAAPVDVAE